MARRTGATNHSSLGVAVGRNQKFHHEGHEEHEEEREKEVFRNYDLPLMRGNTL